MEHNYTTEQLLLMAREVNGYDGSLDTFEWYDMDELEEIMFGQDAHWIACRIHFGDFNPMDDYFSFNGYGNLESIDEWGLEKMAEDWAEDIISRYTELCEDGSLDGEYLEIEDE